MVRRPFGVASGGAPASLCGGGPPLAMRRVGHSGAAGAPAQPELHRRNQHACSCWSSTSA
eukprot:160095-Alexandrium_andersonii.AAC.1